LNLNKEFYITCKISTEGSSPSDVFTLTPGNGGTSWPLKPALLTKPKSTQKMVNDTAYHILLYWIVCILGRWPYITNKL